MTRRLRGFRRPLMISDFHRVLTKHGETLAHVVEHIFTTETTSGHHIDEIFFGHVFSTASVLRDERDLGFLVGGDSCISQFEGRDECCEMKVSNLLKIGKAKYRRDFT